MAIKLHPLYRRFLFHQAIIHVHPKFVAYDRLKLPTVRPQRIIHIHHRLFGRLPQLPDSPPLDRVVRIEAGKHSVLVLDVIQNAWFAGIFLRVVGGNGEKEG